MGTLNGGILGGFTGKVGTVIGFTHNGKSYIRGRMTRYHDARTPAQQEQRARLALVVTFLRPLLALVRVGFKKNGSTGSGFNAAVTYTLENAVTGIFPALTIDYTRVLVCRGRLPGALHAAAVPGAGGVLNFSWEDNSSDFGAHASDRILLCASCAALNSFAWVIGDACRYTGAQVLYIPETFRGHQVHTYMGFCNTGMTEFSDGGWVGVVVVV